MNPLLSLLSEDGTPESVSTMRVCSLVVVLGVIGAWAVVSVQRAELQPLSAEHVSMVLGVLSAKAWQRGREHQSTANSTPPTP